MNFQLSSLQVFILTAAASNNGKVSNRQVLFGFYGFRPSGRRGKMFDRKAIGYGVYNSRQVAVVKSFDRLARRGLVIRVYCHGVTLTPRGELKAHKLNHRVEKLEG